MVEGTKIILGLKGIAVGKETFLTDGFSYSLIISYNLLKNLNFYAIIHVFEWTTTRNNFSNQPLSVSSKYRFFVATITVAVATVWQQKIR